MSAYDLQQHYLAGIGARACAARPRVGLDNRASRRHYHGVDVSNMAQPRAGRLAVPELSNGGDPIDRCLQAATVERARRRPGRFTLFAHASY